MASVESVAPEAVLEEYTQFRGSGLAVAVSLQLHQPFPSTENQRASDGRKCCLHPSRLHAPKTPGVKMWSVLKLASVCCWKTNLFIWLFRRQQIVQIETFSRLNSASHSCGRVSQQKPYLGNQNNLWVDNDKIAGDFNNSSVNVTTVQHRQLYRILKCWNN